MEKSHVDNFNIHLENSSIKGLLIGGFIGNLIKSEIKN